MNTGHLSLRDLKRECRRAAEKLCAEHGYKMDQFSPARGDESINAPDNIQKRFVRDGWMDHIATGTLLLWKRVSHEHDEWDAFLPTEELSEIEYWDSPEAEAHIREMLAEDTAAHAA